LREAEGQDRLTVSSLAVGAAVFIAMAVLLSPWWLIAAVMVAGAAVQAFCLPIRLSRRVILLGGPRDETAPATSAS
jgi:O-antigen/teichoic acid export membrane protein